LERARRDNDRLGFLVGSREEQIQELRDKVQNLSNLAGGGSNAVAHLIKILGDNAVTVRQKLRAAGVVLNYKVDSDVREFVRAYLESVVENADALVDYRIEASELLRKLEGVPRIMSAIERPDPSPIVPVDREAEAEARRIAGEKKRAYIKAATDAIAKEMGYVDNSTRSVPGTNEP
jgi:hypothetical protein